MNLLYTITEHRSYCHEEGRDPSPSAYVYEVEVETIPGVTYHPPRDINAIVRGNGRAPTLDVAMSLARLNLVSNLKAQAEEAVALRQKLKEHINAIYGAVSEITGKDPPKEIP